eukprot:g39151.t1
MATGDQEFCRGPCWPKGTKGIVAKFADETKTDGGTGDPEEIYKNDPQDEEPVICGVVEVSGSVLDRVYKDEGGSNGNLQNTDRPGYSKYGDNVFTRRGIKEHKMQQLIDTDTPMQPSSMPLPSDSIPSPNPTTLLCLANFVLTLNNCSFNSSKLSSGQRSGSGYPDGPYDRAPFILIYHPTSIHIQRISRHFHCLHGMPQPDTFSSPLAIFRSDHSLLDNK